MTGFCDQCDKNDHESCMRIIGNRRLCRTCILNEPDYDCVFGCKCGEWQINVVESMLHKEDSNFIKCPACNEAIHVIYPVEEENQTCCCPFGSVEEAFKKYDWGLECCTVCDNSFGKVMLEKITKYAEEEKPYDCKCSTWYAPAMIEHMNRLGQKCIECKGFITQACVDFCADYAASRSCRCDHVDIKVMECLIKSGKENCPECGKIFNRHMLESKKLASDPVNHPKHYQSEGMEVIDVIEAFKLGFPLGNAIKYILRAGKKKNGLQDLQKAAWYLNYEIGKIIQSHSLKGLK